MIHEMGKRNTYCVMKDTKSDIKLSVIGGGYKRKEVLLVTFAFGIWPKVAKSGYVLLRFDDETNKLYFYNDATKGCKVSTPEHVRTASARFTVDNPEFWKSFIGSYKLRKDRTSNLFYIDLNSIVRS